MSEYMPDNAISILRRQLNIKTTERKNEEARLRQLNEAKNKSSSKCVELTRDERGLREAIEKLRRTLS
ncbi:MAG TPA: hypothetical protein VMX36_00105 [Sedimentisphaerales bacterium]|nr:hypothetical protein [Sedimentisphaerales bacterium]